MLKQAEALSPSGKIRGEIANAEACAIRELVIISYTDTRKDRETGLKNQNFLANAVAEQAASHASDNPYVNLHTITLQSRRTGLHNHPRLAEFDRRLFIEIEEVNVRLGTWQRTDKTAPGKMWVQCPEEAALCQKDVTVSYVESRRYLTITPKGSMSMMTASEDEVWRYNIEKEAPRSIRYADKFTAGGVAVNIGTQKRLGMVVLSDELYTLSQNPRDLSPNKVSKELFQGLAESVAQGLVNRAAREAEVPEIVTLQIEPAN